MSKENQQTQEGGTDLDGLNDFIMNVNDPDGSSDFANKDDVKVDLGDDNDTEDKDKDTSSEDRTEPAKSTEVEDVDDTKGGSDDDSDDTDDKSKDQPKKDDVQLDKTDSYYGTMARKLIEKGKWQDAEVELESGTFKLSELDEIPEEIFFEIHEKQSDFSKEDIESNYFKKGDFDENKLKIVQILKEGGDLKEIFDSPEEMKRPFEDADLDDQATQQKILFGYYTQVQKLEPEDAKDLVTKSTERMDLDEKVNKIVTGFQKNYDDKLSAKLKEIEDNKAKQKEADREFKKGLLEIFNNSDLDKKFASKLADLGIKRDSDGDFELDKVYAEKMKDPQEAADLIYFLTDKEGFMKNKASKAVLKKQSDNIRKMSFVNSKNKGGSSSQDDNKSREAEEDNEFKFTVTQE